MRRTILNGRVLFLCAFLLTFLSIAFAQERLTITTYYPSPYGVYKLLRLVPDALTADTDCTSSREGAMQYSNTEHRPLVCTNITPAGAPTLRWKPAAGEVPPGTWCGHCDSVLPGNNQSCKGVNICSGGPCPLGWTKVTYTIGTTTFVVCIKQ